jgi:hypothetical protein
MNIVGPRRWRTRTGMGFAAETRVNRDGNTPDPTIRVTITRPSFPRNSRISSSARIWERSSPGSGNASVPASETRTTSGSGSRGSLHCGLSMRT